MVIDDKNVLNNTNIQNKLIQNQNDNSAYRSYKIYQEIK